MSKWKSGTVYVERDLRDQRRVCITTTRGNKSSGDINGLVLDFVHWKIKRTQTDHNPAMCELDNGIQWFFEDKQLMFEILVMHPKYERIRAGHRIEPTLVTPPRDVSCPDCKGSGQYIGFTHTTNCETCNLV